MKAGLSGGLSRYLQGKKTSQVVQDSSINSSFNHAFLFTPWGNDPN